MPRKMDDQGATAWTTPAGGRSTPSLTRGGRVRAARPVPRVSPPPEISGTRDSKIGVVDGTLEELGDNFWEGADKFQMKGAARRKIGEIYFGSVD